MPSSAKSARLESKLIPVLGTFRKALQEPCCFCAPARSCLTIAEAVDIVEAQHLGALCGFAAVTYSQVRGIRPLVSVQATLAIANPPAGLAKSLKVGPCKRFLRLKGLAIEHNRAAPVVPFVGASGLAEWRVRYCHSNAFCHS